jgi:hypothetical protein
MTENADTVKTNKLLLKERKKKCYICGETTYCCLELHHIRDKLYTISHAVRNLPTPLFVKEMDKCIVVCSNCHKKLHNNIIKYEEDK